MSRQELAPSGKGSRVKNNGPAGSVEKPKGGLAEWMGQKPGKHPMLPLYPPGDRRSAAPTEVPPPDPARAMQELRGQRIAERETEERREAETYGRECGAIFGFVHAHPVLAPGEVAVLPTVTVVP